MYIQFWTTPRKLHKDRIGTSGSGYQKKDSRGILELLVYRMHYTFIVECIYLRGRDEPHELKPSQSDIKVDDPSLKSEKVKCVIYTEHRSKDRPGTMHHVHLENKCVTDYANVTLRVLFRIHFGTIYLQIASKSI